MDRGDLTAEQRLRLEVVLPPLPVTGRRPWDRRQVFNGIWWRARTGSPWRDIPERYGPHETGCTLFRRWQIDGTWSHTLRKSQVKADAAGHTEWEVPVDSRVCRAHQHAAGARKGAHHQGRTEADSLAAAPDDHELGRSRGGLSTKIYLAADAPGTHSRSCSPAGSAGTHPLRRELAMVCKGKQKLATERDIPRKATKFFAQRMTW